jgi:hypothetical protein
VLRLGEHLPVGVADERRDDRRELHGRSLDGDGGVDREQ